MKVRDLRPGMVYSCPMPFNTSMIFVTQSRHPLWSGLQLVVWRDVETDKVVFDALDSEMVLDGRVHEADGETRLAWLRRGVLGREGAEEIVRAIAQASDVNLEVVRNALESLRQSEQDAKEPELVRGRTRAGRPVFVCTSEADGHRAMGPREK